MEAANCVDLLAVETFSGLQKGCSTGFSDLVQKINLKIG